MTTAELGAALADTGTGHLGVWPDGEDQRMRDAYDLLLAEQAEKRQR